MKTITNGPDAGAIFDDFERFRFRLWRTFEAALDLDPDKRMCFVMLNPSTADAFVLDPTVTRCIGFAKREGCGRLDVVNCFALRSTDPKALRKAIRHGADPVGPGNDDHIIEAASEADVVVAAWGAHAKLLDRGARVLDLLHDAGPVHCLAWTKDGTPGHPLYVKADRPLVRISRPDEWATVTL